MTEREFRAAIVAEALTWIGTPYKLCGCIKGVGVNCAQLLFGVAKGAGIIPQSCPTPRWYTPQLATHSRDERLMRYFAAYGAREVNEPQDGDIVLFKTGLAHGHAAIVTAWPEIVHCLPPHGCQLGRVDEGRLAQFKRRYFTLWRSD